MGRAGMRARAAPQLRGGRQRGDRRARGGDAVLLLNADCFLRPGFLAAALPQLTEPAVGSVAPKLLRAGAAPGATARQIDAAGMFVDRRRKNGLVGHGRPAAAFGSRRRRSAPTVPPRCIAGRRSRSARSAAGEVLDEDMELWASDADLAWRAQLLGWRSVYEPAAVAEHIRTYSPLDAFADERGLAAAAVPQPLSDDVKNETRAGLRGTAGWIAGLRGARARPRAAA